MIDSLGAPHITRQDRGDEDRLRTALAPGGLRLALQPIVTLSGARVAVELIARPRDGTPPDLLFSLARAAGVEPAL